MNEIIMNQTAIFSSGLGTSCSKGSRFSFCLSLSSIGVAHGAFSAVPVLKLPFKSRASSPFLSSFVPNSLSAPFSSSPPSFLSGMLSTQTSTSSSSSLLSDISTLVSLLKLSSCPLEQSLSSTSSFSCSLLSSSASFSYCCAYRFYCMSLSFCICRYCCYCYFISLYC